MLVTLSLATVLGLYGFYMIMTLTASPVNSPNEFRSERLMLGVFNILISVFAIYAVMLIMQIDEGELFTQSNKLLEQLK